MSHILGKLVSTNNEKNNDGGDVFCVLLLARIQRILYKKNDKLIQIRKSFIHAPSPFILFSKGEGALGVVLYYLRKS